MGFTESTYPSKISEQELEAAKDEATKEAAKAEMIAAEEAAEAEARAAFEAAQAAAEQQDGGQTEPVTDETPAVDGPAVGGDESSAEGTGDES